MSIEKGPMNTVDEGGTAAQAETGRPAGASSALVSEMFSLFLSNPLFAQGRILERLSPNQQWIGGGGLVFLNVMGLYLMILGLIRGLFGAWVRFSAGDYFGFFVVCLIPVGALFGAFLLLSRMGGGKGVAPRPNLFKAGFSLLPTTAALFLAWLWLSAVGVVQIVPLILAFGLSFTLLLMFGALRELPALNETKAFFLTPVLISLSIILSGVLAQLVL